MRGRLRDLNRKIRKSDRAAMRLTNARNLARLHLGAKVGEPTADAVVRLMGERRRIDSKLRYARIALELAV